MQIGLTLFYLEKFTLYNLYALLNRVLNRSTVYYRGRTLTFYRYLTTCAADNHRFAFIVIRMIKECKDEYDYATPSGGA